MMDYDSEGQLTAVAQSCRRFDSGRLTRNKYNNTLENMSCRICRNWDGSRCVTNAFDNVLTSFDQE